MPKDKTSAKNVRDIKAEEPKQPSNQMQIEPGNVPILTVKLLDTINKNLLILVQQNAIIVKAIQEEPKDGGSK